MFFLETFLQSSIFTLWWNCCACQTHPNERCSLALKTSQNCKQCIPGLCKLMKYQSVCGRIEGNNSHVLSRPSSFLLPSRGGYLAWTAATVRLAHLQALCRSVWGSQWPTFGKTFGQSIYPSDSTFSQWYSLWVVMMSCGGGLDLFSLCLWHVIGLPGWFKFQCKSSLNTQWQVKVRAAAQSSTLWPRILFVTLEAPKSAWMV